MPLRVEDELKYALKTKNEKIINQAFESIYYEYCNLVGFVISKYVDSKLDVEELVDDVFVSLFNNLNRIKIKNIKAYLTTSAKNKAIDYLRKNNNSYILENDIIYKHSDDNLYSIIIKDMKDKLSDLEINIIIEHVIYDKTFKVIAKELNKPTSTISTIYYQAIKKYKMED